MKLIAMFIFCCLARDLLRKNIARPGGRCHAWAWTTSNGVLRRPHLHRFRSPVLFDNHPERRHRSNLNADNNNNINRDNQNRLFQSTWTGDMAPFSEFATHVKVGKDDAPITVESAILRSMTTLGASSVRISDDGGSYIVPKDNHLDDNIDTNNSRHPPLIIEEILGEFPTNETVGGSEAKIIARHLKDHPPNSPMTPHQLLHLGGIWYLSAEHYRNNQELLAQEEDANKGIENEKRNEGNTKQRRHERSNTTIKPSRLSLSNSSMILREGDYLRIHRTPRRFPGVYNVDWSFPSVEVANDDSNDNIDKEMGPLEKLPAVVHQEGTGYCIINKPPIIPVHATVDNAVENVAHQLYLALEEKEQQITSSFGMATQFNATDIIKKRSQQQQTHKPEATPYLAAVHRIDVNTSGLLVLATSPEFAAYFSKLLQRKTAATNDKNHSSKNSTSDTATSTSATIEKGYKCLVCIQPDESSGESVIQAWKRLSKLQRPKLTPPSMLPSARVDDKVQRNSNRTVIIRHYLKASNRAPKLFVDTIPEDDDDDSNWYECLMELTNIGDPIPLYASNNDDGSSTLTNGLWPKVGPGSSDNNRMPPTTKAVVEVEVSLITGRTHQIRGQLSKLGFPIVGDEQYGGAISPEEQPKEGLAYASLGSQDPQLLALQCCHIGFRDAEYESVWHKKKRREILRGRPSHNGRWVRATLEKAWWTPYLEDHRNAKDGNQFSDIDFQDANQTVFTDTVTTTISTSDEDIRSDMLPPTVQLSPGRNKYVVAKLRDPSTKKLRWFVQSAPLPYHAEVAFDLTEWIAAVPGYEQIRVEVTGGGRIDYNPGASTVNVYGFSYRYGKGDHARVANLIETSELGAGLEVSYDLSDKLY